MRRGRLAAIRDRRRADVPQAVLARARANAIERLIERHHHDYLELLEAEMAKASPITSIA